MNKYLIEILKIQNSVILPGLGALMVPSQKTGKIVFNPHLKFNDGSLARFIAEKEGIDEQESQNKVAKFVREIEAEIGKGNSYDMFEFGRFYKNKDGEVDFDMFKEGEDQAAALGATTEAKPKKKLSPPIKEKTEKPVAEKETPKKEDKKPVVKKTTAKKTTKKSKETTEDKDKATEDSKQSKNKFIPPVVEEVKEDLTKKVEAAEEKVADKVEKVKEKIEDKTKATGKGIGAIISDAKEKVEEKVEEVKEKVEEKVEAAKEAVEEKVEEVKEKITGAADKKAIITPVVEATKAEDKQSKNKFIPPTGSDKKTEDAHDKGAAAATVAAGAAIVSGTVAAGNSDGKTIVEKTKESTTIVKETVVKEEKKKRRIWPWIILLLLLAGIAAAGYFFKDKIMAYFNGDDNAVVADSTATQDSTADNSTIIPVEFEDSLMNNDTDWVDSSGTDIDNMNNAMDETDPIESPIEDPVDEVVPVTGSNSGSYHLIGNSFGEEANAERYAQSMRDKGYPAKVLGRFDGLYMVSLKSYDSREAANDGRSSVSADASSAWVFKY